MFQYQNLIICSKHLLVKSIIKTDIDLSVTKFTVLVYIYYLLKYWFVSLLIWKYDLNTNETQKRKLQDFVKKKKSTFFMEMIILRNIELFL